VSAQMALFAGRRSTDRIFLLLQNLLCARHLPNYMGTSSVYAISLIDRTARRLGMTQPEQRHQLTGAHMGGILPLHQPLHVCCACQHASVFHVSETSADLQLLGLLGCGQWAEGPLIVTCLSRLSSRTAGLSDSKLQVQ
jgi:hypothetical protein